MRRESSTLRGPSVPRERRPVYTPFLCKRAKSFYAKCRIWRPWRISSGRRRAVSAYFFHIAVLYLEGGLRYLGALPDSPDPLRFGWYAASVFQIWRPGFSLSLLMVGVGRWRRRG